HAFLDAGLSRLGPAPQRLQGRRQALGLDPVGRVEMVPFLEDLESEVREDFAEPAGDLAELVGVAQLAQGEVDRAIEARQRPTIEVIGPKRLHERADPARTLRHPGRRIPRRWWGQLDSRPDVASHERTHELV